MKTKELFKHQQDAIDGALPVLITDRMAALFFDPGLGKTLTAMVLADKLVRMGRAKYVIVVSPKSLMQTWTDEIEKHVGEVNVARWEPTRLAGKTYAQELKSFHYRGGYFLTNYEAYQNPRKELAAFLAKIIPYSVVICDESTRIKTHDAKQTKTILNCFTQAVARMILTGTEITKSPLDIWSQLEFLKKGFWPERSFYVFRKKYAILSDVALPNGVSFKKIVGYMRLNDIQERIAPFVFRAKKADCFDLPDKIHEVITVELSAEESRVYKDMKKHLFTVLQSGEIISVQQKMTLFMRFRTITGGWADTENKISKGSPSKLATLVDLIDDDEEQAIIWCSFSHEIRMVEEELKKHGTCVTYYGDVSQALRDESQRRFTDGSARFFIANPAAAGWGLNLQHCTLQYFYSLPTSPEQYLQSLDRSHRIGTKSNVVYRYLLGKGSVDFRIKELLDQSSDLLSRFQTSSLEEMINMV